MAWLYGYQLAFTYKSSTRQSHVLDVVPSKGSAVIGIVFSVTKDQLDYLDKKEGAPYAYRRLQCIVHTHTGEKIDATTYEVVNKVPFDKPLSSYTDIVAAGYENFGLPKSYLYDAIKNKKN